MDAVGLAVGGGIRVVFAINVKQRPTISTTALERFIPIPPYA